MEKNSSQSMLMVAATFLVALVIGIGGGVVIGENKEKNEQKDSVTMAKDSEKDDKSFSNDEASHSEAEHELRSSLQGLLSEHVYLALHATRSGFDGHADFEEIAASLDENSVEIADAIGSVYGEDAKTAFLANWRDHIGFFVDYTVATKAKDAAGQQKAVDNLMGYIGSASAFFANANPNLKEEDVKAEITDHVLELKASVDAYAEGDFTKAYNLQREGAVHMSMFANTLAGAIAEQYPDKF